MRRAAAALVLAWVTALLPAQAKDEARGKKAGKNPYYGAMAFHQATGSVGWATDRPTSRDARLEALRQCQHPRCEIVATVTRGCLAIAREPKKFSAQRGTTRQEAETKALRRCGERCEIAGWTCTR